MSETAPEAPLAPEDAPDEADVTMFEEDDSPETLVGEEVPDNG